MLAADAAVAVLAAVAARLDVGWLGAQPERHRDLADLAAQPLAGGQLLDQRHGAVAVAVDLQRREGLHGVAGALVADAEVALGGDHAAVAHQLAQHLDRGAVVGVALGIAVPERVGDDARSGQTAAVAIEQRRQRVTQQAHDPSQVAGVHRPGAARVAVKPREQPQLGGWGVGIALADPPLLGGDQLGGLLVDRQPAAGPGDLGHVVDEHRQLAGLAVVVDLRVEVQAVPGQDAELVRAPAGVGQQLDSDPHPLAVHLLQQRERVGGE